MFRFINFIRLVVSVHYVAFAYGAVGPNAIYQDKYGQWYQSTDVVGGNAMATASVELIVPTPFVGDKSQNSVRTSFFVDAASVWNTKWKSDKEGLKSSPIYATLPDYSKAGRVRASTGVAFQWQSPNWTIGILLTRNQSKI